MESTNEMDNTPEASLYKLSEVRNAGIVIRCLRNETDVMVNTGEIIGSNATVRVKFDDGTPTRQNWSRSTDHTALFAPNAMAFARRLVKHQKFLVEFSPYDKGPQILKFDLTGLPDKLPAVEKACNWAAIDASQAKTRALAEKAKADEAELQRKMVQALMPFIEPCREKWVPAGRWCWHDAENTSPLWQNSPPKATKEEALQDALHWAKEGRAFQSVMSHLN